MLAFITVNRTSRQAAAPSARFGSAHYGFAVNPQVLYGHFREAKRIWQGFSTFPWSRTNL